MLFKMILRVLLGQVQHHTVSRHLRKDGGRRDIRTAGVALDDAAARRLDTRIAVAVDQRQLRLRPQLRDRAVHGEEGRVEDVPLLDLFHRGEGDPEAEGLRRDDVEQLLPLFLRELFGVVEPGDLQTHGQDHRRRADRSGKRPSPGLVHTAEQTKALVVYLMFQRP